MLVIPRRQYEVLRSSSGVKGHAKLAGRLISLTLHEHDRTGAHPLTGRHYCSVPALIPVLNQPDCWRHSTTLALPSIVTLHKYH
jgi:hypothetical protein